MSMDRSLSPTIKAVMLACCAAFVLQNYVVGLDFIGIFGLIPAQVLHHGWIWQVVTYMFLHGSFMHLFLNLIAFWMFGRAVEDAWGSAEFLKYCLICGIGGAVCNIAVTPNSPIPIIGSSAVVYGLLEAFAMIYP